MSAPTEIKLPFSNDGSFMEQFMKMQQAQQKSQQEDSKTEPTGKDLEAEPSKQDSQASPSTAAPAADAPEQKDQEVAPEQPANTSAVPEPDGAPFIASKTFTGSKEGYVFKADKEGTGYYLDTKEVLQRQKPVKGKPAVLKTNNPIVRIQPKMSAADSRKRKLGEFTTVPYAAGVTTHPPPCWNWIDYMVS